MESEDASLELKDILIKAGYSELDRYLSNYTVSKIQSQYDDIISEALLENEYAIETFHSCIVGSIGEGTFLETSDVDLISFTSDFEVPDADYKLIRSNPGHLKIKNCIDDVYLSSQEALNDLSKRYRNYPNIRNVVKFLKTRGPSTPFRLRGTDVKIDHTFAILYNCSALLRKWALARTTWPPKEVIEKVRSLPALLVPVGQKGSKDEDLQWRICFNFAEKTLVYSLNLAQYHLYIVLKILKCELLKEICPDISSFALKNIVFLLVESLPETSFNHDELLLRVVDCLKLLKTAVLKRSLPYFMIPERNLFANKISEDSQKSVVDLLARVISNPIVINKSVASFFSKCERNPLLETGQYLSMISDEYSHSSVNLYASKRKRTQACNKDRKRMRNDDYK